MKSKKLGVIVGSLLAVAGIVWIFFFRPDPVVEEAPPLVRPIKSLVVGAERGPVERTYPGKVDAVDTVMLSFEVAGNLQEKLVKKGDRVKQDQLLARLNPADFKSRVDAAEAQEIKAKADFERIENLFATGNASPSEVEASEAAYNVAKSDLERAEKALKDTELKARFDGVIADSFPDQFENVSAGQAIYRLQGEDSGLQIKIQVPENHIARRDLSSVEENVDAVATFDFLPEETTFQLELKDFASIADPATQTYQVSFRMEDPGDTNILPGMSSTVRVTMKPGAAGDAAGLYAPLNAVPPDESGQYFVWKLEEKGNGEFAAVRKDVTVGEMRGNDILITGGLTKGERIAAAGVRVLQEGQVVRLQEE